MTKLLQKYGHVAFDSSQKAVLTSSVLRYKPLLNSSSSSPTKKEDEVHYSQNLIIDNLAHPAPITCICVVPSLSTSPAPSDDSTHIIASASHDLTAQLTQISLSPGANADPNSSTSAKPLATMHLHTVPLSSLSPHSTGSHLLTSSWDGLIGLWDTSIPPHDEVPAAQELNDRGKKRRRATDDERPKRKAPITVLKSHTARVSKAVFENAGDGVGVGRVAFSCGFDSTMRMWDVENSVCTHTIVRRFVPTLPLSSVTGRND
jgi:ribosome biogenesis protein YTM1